MNNRRSLVAILLFTQLAVAISVAAADKKGSATGDFVLTKGHGVPVCDAYLKRLNAASYEEQPYCDRPEKTDVKGFEELNRIPLKQDEAFALGNRIYNFTHEGNQDTYPNQRSFIDRQIIQNELGHSIRTWRYEPPIDIDNDGAPETVLVWHGYGASSGLYRCGSVKEKEPRRQSQIAYVLESDGMRINEKRTRELFGHPSGGYRVSAKEQLKAFRPIGRTIGIFKYRRLYYFDTFFDSSGDFDNRRQKDPGIGDTLGVFLNKGGATKQMCEYRWNSNSAAAR